MKTATPRFSYTQNAWEGEKYRANERLYGSSLSKAIRQELKDKIPNCKFSVTSETYSGGQSVSISLMSANFNPFNEITDEIKEKIKLRCMCSFPNSWQNAYDNALENYIRETTIDFNHGVNQYYVKDDICLTEKAKEVINEMLKIAQSYNFDDSDGQIDYFHTNFYLHAGIGRWNKPFIQSK